MADERGGASQQFGSAAPSQPAGGPQSAQTPNAGPPQQLQQPFALTPAEEVELDRVLLFWQQSSQNVRTFRAAFTRFDYNPLWADPANPSAPVKDSGELNFEAPDKGAYSIDEKSPRAEKWICDGKSLFEYDYRAKVVREIQLPPQAQGKGLIYLPVPFIFGAKAQDLKALYWMRKITPQNAKKGEVWLEVFPRYPAQAQNFKKVEVILSAQGNDVMPSAVNIFQPGGQSQHGVRPGRHGRQPQGLSVLGREPLQGQSAGRLATGAGADSAGARPSPAAEGRQSRRHHGQPPDHGPALVVDARRVARGGVFDVPSHCRGNLAAESTDMDGARIGATAVK